MRILTEEGTKFQSENVLEKKEVKYTEGVEKDLLFRFKLIECREHKLCDDTG